MVQRIVSDESGLSHNARQLLFMAPVSSGATSGAISGLALNVGMGAVTAGGVAAVGGVAAGGIYTHCRA